MQKKKFKLNSKLYNIVGIFIFIPFVSGLIRNTRDIEKTEKCREAEYCE